MKITNRYMPDTNLQACDVVRLIKEVRSMPRDAVFTPLYQFLQLACRDTGWNPKELLEAIIEES